MCSPAADQQRARDAASMHPSAGGWVAPTADDFFTRQVDAWVDGDWAMVDPDGGLDDDYDDALAASWGDEAWDDADVY